jgi:molybdopterin molybdotransferase
MATLVGAADVAAFRRLRVGVLSTGDELADPPAALAAAGSYDANRPTLVAAARRLGFDTSDLGICADEPTAFSRILGAALDLRLDALIVSGGAAQGDADIVRQAGGIEFLPLNFRPGRGIAFAHLRRGDAALALLGLPGNAVAAFIMFHLVARPVLLHLAGADADVPRHLPLPLAVDVEVRGGRIEYRRARFVGGADGRLAVVPLKEQGSAMLRTVTDADALIALGPQPRYRAGEPVGTIPLALLE